jgi:4-hydroxythreonine-4-phosphate dehydrogenase
MADKPRIGLFIGDPTGIGPEITAKVLTNREIYTKCYPLVIGDDRAFRVGQKIAQTDLKYSPRKDIHEVSISSLDFTFFDLENLDPNKIILGKMSSLSGKAVGDTIKSSIDLATKGIIDAFVYAPINKEALYRGGCPFKAEIDFFAHLLGLTTGFGEMNVLEDLWTSRVTSHISLGEVTKHITRDMVLQAIKELP